MSNSYTKAAFTLVVTSAEADILRAVPEIVDLVADGSLTLAELDAAWSRQSAGFQAAFPRAEHSPFDAILDLFEDPNFLQLHFDMVICEPDVEGAVQVHFSGEQFDVDAAARLIQRVARSALPTGFEYACTSDRLRNHEFGGGYICITQDAITGNYSSRLLDQAVAHAKGEDAYGLVLSTRDKDYGPLFWNDATGFADLREARVFSEAEAQDFDLSICNDEPEWLALPMPLS